MSEIMTTVKIFKTFADTNRTVIRTVHPPLPPPIAAAAIATTPSKHTGIIDDDVHPLASPLPARDQHLCQPFRVVCQKVLGTGSEHLREYITAAGRVSSILGTTSVRTWGGFWECLLSSSYRSTFVGTASKFPS